MNSDCISQDISPGYVCSNALLQFRLKLELCKLHKVACHPTRCDVINDVKLFQTVYRIIYCHKFLTLSNQMSRYKSMCIRILYLNTSAADDKFCNIFPNFQKK